MSNKSKLIIIGAVALVIVLFSVSYYSGYLEQTVFMAIIDQYAEPEWDEISSRYLVKNSMPITVIEKQNNKCVLSALRISDVVDHKFFPKGADLAKKLSYDDDTKTIVLSCDEIPNEEKSRLNIWFVTSDAKQHAEKYMYFVTTFIQIENSTELLPFDLD